MNIFWMWAGYLYFFSFLLVFLLFNSTSERAGALTFCMLDLHVIVVFPAKTGILLTGSSSGARGVELGALLE